MQVLTTAAFTEDMAATLYRFHNRYAKAGVVRIEVATNGLWMVNPHDGSRQFLGLAAFEDGKAERLSRRGIASDLTGDA